MRSAFLWNLMLADPKRAPRFEDVGQRFREGGNDMAPHQWLLFVGVLGGIALATALAVWLFQLRERRGYRHPWSLFHELCRAHRLDMASRRLLKRLVAAQGLSQPAQLFVAPERFDGPGVAAFDDRQRRDLIRLRDRLFGKRAEELGASG